MCSQKTASACGTSGSRELRRGRVPDERAARLQADGIGTNDASLSGGGALREDLQRVRARLRSGRCGREARYYSSLRTGQRQKSGAGQRTASAIEKTSGEA